MGCLVLFFLLLSFFKENFYGLGRFRCTYDEMTTSEGKDLILITLSDFFLV